MKCGLHGADAASLPFPCRPGFCLQQGAEVEYGSCCAWQGGGPACSEGGRATAKLQAAFIHPYPFVGSLPSHSSHKSDHVQVPCWTLPETLDLRIITVGAAALLTGATSCLPKFTAGLCPPGLQSHVREKSIFRITGPVYLRANITNKDNQE